MPNVVLCQVCSSLGCDCMQPRTRTPTDVEIDHDAFRASVHAEFAHLGPVFQPVPCRECGQMFTPKHPFSRYCQPECLRAGDRRQQRAAKAKRQPVGLRRRGTAA